MKRILPNWDRTTWFVVVVIGSLVLVLGASAVRYRVNLAEQRTKCLHEFLMDSEGDGSYRGTSFVCKCTKCGYIERDISKCRPADLRNALIGRPKAVSSTSVSLSRTNTAED